MNVAWTLVDDRALAVSVEAAHRVFVRVAVGAVNLHGVARRALGGDRRKPLGQPGLTCIAPAMVFQPPRSHPQQPRCLVVRFHLRDQLFHELMRPDFHAERFSLLGVFDTRVAAGTNEPGGSSRYGVATLIEGEHRNLEALPLAAHEILRWNFDLFHFEETGVASENPPLFGEGATRETLECPLDDERAHARRIAL